MNTIKKPKLIPNCMLTRIIGGHVTDNRSHDCSDCENCGWNEKVHSKRMSEITNEGVTENKWNSGGKYSSALKIGKKIKESGVAYETVK